MTTDSRIVRSVFSERTEDANHGQEADRRSNNETNSRDATAAKMQDSSQNCTQGWRSTTNCEYVVGGIDALREVRL
jgi:hypothetical protein